MQNYDSPIYRKKIARMTRLAKSLYPSLSRVPAPLPRPNSKSYQNKANASNGEMKKRQEDFDRVDSRRLDKSTVAFWANGYTLEEKNR